MFSLAHSGLMLLFTSASLIIFITVRHLALQRRRLARLARLARSIKPPLTPGCESTFFSNHATSILIVLGSGGHTKEMLLMLEAGFGKFRAMHRRYMVSSGDAHSLHAMKDFEDGMAASHDNDTGTYDAVVVKRARRVHQSLLTTPFSAAMSFFRILPLLARQSPDLIITNGPATGFFVGLAAYLLKLFCLVPATKMHVMYIESWARVKTLSLTGKLFYYTGLADTFLVQHEPIAQAYSVTNAGWLVTVPRQEQ